MGMKIYIYMGISMEICGNIYGNIYGNIWELVGGAITILKKYKRQLEKDYPI